MFWEYSRACLWFNFWLCYYDNRIIFKNKYVMELSKNNQFHNGQFLEALLLLWKLYHPIKIFTRALLNVLSVMWNRRFCRFHIIQNFLWVYDNISRKKIQQKCPETLFLRVNSLLLGTANKPIQKSAYEKIISSSLSALIAWIKRSLFLCLMRRKFWA